MKRHFKYAFLLLLLLPQISFAVSFTGKVVGVSDGDTIKVMHNGKAEKVRLSGIDSPEKKQAFGNKAKQFTSDLVFGKVVKVQVSDIDRYGRSIGEVFLPDGRSLNRELVKAGFAWWYFKYSKDVTLGELEKEARLAKKGLILSFLKSSVLNLSDWCVLQMERYTTKIHH